MEKVLYTGVVVNQGELMDLLYALNPSVGRLGRLSKIVPSNYISVAFREGTEGHEKYFGKKVVLKIVGYGRDDNNEGFKAEIYPTGDAGLDYILRGVPDPVIPLSTSAKGLIKNTKTLKYWSLFNPFFIEGTYVGIDKSGKFITEEKG